MLADQVHTPLKDDEIVTRQFSGAHVSVRNDLHSYTSVDDAFYT